MILTLPRDFQAFGDPLLQMANQENNPTTARRNAEVLLSQLDRAFQELARLVGGELQLYQDQTPLRAIRKTTARTRRRLSVQAASPGEPAGATNFMIRLDVRKSVDEGWYSWVRIARLQMHGGHERQLATLIQYWAQLENVPEGKLTFHSRADDDGGLIRVPSSTVHVTGWNTGFSKTRVSELVQQYLPEIDQPQIARMLNDLLVGIPFRLQVPNAEQAELLRDEITAAHGIGFVVHDKNASALRAARGRDTSPSLPL
jgi:hypothetical protein